ncbi:Vegetative incompatibility protein HET-E-1 [Metarhizium brunneum]|uniref:Vegetative incompatibility protein HET-E-1 n=1 Tax=Metarhizium brunneum TaxID=500148 RepID=A0A7D5UW49_9HYPO
MRLLNVDSLQLKYFVGEPGHGVPGYAILSHVWGDDEISFQEMTENVYPSTPASRKGLQKILGFCDKAKSDGHSWVWIDTCCIDKSSSAELSEAINSMFNWYRNAAACYAYLFDVTSDEDPAGPQSAFRSSKWFTRGWTLQELLAPFEVAFLAMDWRELGAKSDLARIIAEITRIDQQVLSTCVWDDVSIAAIMSWAANRRTTRVEDEAYCLTGLFNVNMPLIYGEGRNAFYNLQLEIIKSSDDQSIFAWTCEPEGPSTLSLYEQDARPLGMLATSPRAFAKCSAIVDTYLHTDHDISFDIEKQFVRLVAATMQLCREVKVESEKQLIPVSFVVPTAAHSDPDGAVISMADVIKSWPRQIPWGHVHIAVLRCTDDEGHIVILMEKKSDGKYERIGSHHFPWLRALVTENKKSNQTMHIRARAKQHVSKGNRDSLRGSHYGGNGAVVKTIPGSGYMISHSRPANFTPVQGKIMSYVDMNLVGSSIKKAIGVVTPLVLFFRHARSAEHSSFAIRFDRVGPYGSYLYKISFRVGVTVWEDDGSDKQNPQNDKNGETAQSPMFPPDSPQVSFPISSDCVLRLRYRRTAPMFEDFVNVSIETPLPWQPVLEDPLAAWAVFFAHNFGRNAENLAQFAPQDRVTRTKTLCHLEDQQDQIHTSTTRAGLSEPKRSMSKSPPLAASLPGSADVKSDLRGATLSADCAVSDTLPA